MSSFAAKLCGMAAFLLRPAKFLKGTKIQNGGGLIPRFKCGVLRKSLKISSRFFMYICELTWLTVLG
jgi:hypothetical protein